MVEMRKEFKKNEHIKNALIIKNYRSQRGNSLNNVSRQGTICKQTFYDMNQNKLAIAALTSYKSVFSFFQLF